MQCQIQDVPEGDANLRGCVNLLFGQFFLKNYMNIKIIGWDGARPLHLLP